MLIYFEEIQKNLDWDCVRVVCTMSELWLRSLMWVCSLNACRFLLILISRRQYRHTKNHKDCAIRRAYRGQHFPDRMSSFMSLLRMTAASGRTSSKMTHRDTLYAASYFLSQHFCYTANACLPFESDENVQRHVEHHTEYEFQQLYWLENEQSRKGVISSR